MSAKRVIACLFLLLFSSICSARIDWNDRQVKWYSFADGLRVAKKENKNIVVVVYADWCPACKLYSRMFFDRGVIDNSRGVVLIRLNQDTQWEYAKQFTLDGDYVPRTYIVGSDLTVRPSPYRGNGYRFFLPPNNNGYLAGLLKKLSSR